MTPAEYAAEIAIPTAIEFRDDRMSRRRGYLACVVTFHLKDHLQKAGALGIESAMRSACGNAFDVVRSVCNGSKHVETNASHVVPFKAGQDWRRPPAFFGQMVLGVSRLGDRTGGREISTSTGRVDLYASVRAVLLAYERSFPTHLVGCDFSAL